jgi:hypothetical protein
MKLNEFIEQLKYCRENNIPEGKGCSECPSEEKEDLNMCADNLVNLAGKLMTENIGTQEWGDIVVELILNFGECNFTISKILEESK